MSKLDIIIGVVVVLCNLGAVTFAMWLGRK